MNCDNIMDCCKYNPFSKQDYTYTPIKHVKNKTEKVKMKKNKNEEDKDDETNLS